MSEKKDAPSRRSQFEASRYNLNPVAWGVNEVVEGYLLAACQQIGWVMGGGMGPSPLTYLEIRAYCEGRGISNQWEFDAIRNMSIAYIRGLDSKVDPANWSCYKGALLPLVMPNDLDVARIMVMSFEGHGHSSNPWR